VLAVVGLPGRVLAVAVVACWVASARLGWLELRVAALAGLGALAAAALLTLGRSSYAVALELQSPRVVVGERAVGRVAVANTSTRRLLPARLELPVGRGLAAFDLPSLGAGAEHEDLFTIPTSRRSVVVVGPVRSVRGDPFSLLRRELVWTGATELFVHPRTVPLQGSAAGFVRDLEGQVSRSLTNSDVAFHALRGYVPGDDRRYVHWRTSARTGTLMVRQFEETRRSHLAVALSTAGGDYLDADSFELAVSCAGSLALQALRDERSVSVLTSLDRLPTVSGPRLLDAFSGVETDSAAPRLAELSRRTAQEVPDASVAVLVTGAAPTPADLRAAASALPVDVRVLALRAVPGEEAGCRTVGDLTVVTVGDLADLPRTVRRAGAL
jgi:uncharacterized protein (DUF58 family)